MFNILKAGLEIAPKNEIRYYMNGLHIARRENILNVEATDGHIAFRATFTDPDVVNMFPLEFDKILSHASLSQMMKIFKKNDVVQFDILDDAITVKGLRIETIDGNFPQIDRVLNGLENKRGTSTGLTFSLLERVGKVAKIAMQSVKVETGVMNCGDGISVIEFKFSIPQVEMVVVLSPAKV